MSWVCAHDGIAVREGQQVPRTAPGPAQPRPPAAIAKPAEGASLQEGLSVTPDVLPPPHTYHQELKGFNPGKHCFVVSAHTSSEAALGLLDISWNDVPLTSPPGFVD